MSHTSGVTILDQGSCVVVEVRPETFRYRIEQLRAWEDTSSDQIATELLALAGSMNRGPYTYHNQRRLGQNFPEVLYAGHLVKTQDVWPRDIYYENYSLAHSAVERHRAARPNKTAAWCKYACERVFDTFSDRFLRAFEVLQVHNNLPLDANVDLFVAARTPAHPVRFVELKLWRADKGCAEEMPSHQVAFFGILEFLFARLGQDCFRDCRLRHLDCRLICCVPSGVAQPEDAHSTETTTILVPDNVGLPSAARAS